MTDVLFFNPFPKNAQIMNLKNPDLDLIWRIHLECGFFGFMFRFWILVIKRKSVFGFKNPDSDFPKKRTLINIENVNSVNELCSLANIARNKVATGVYSSATT